MTQVWITTQNDAAIFEADVTGVIADSAPEALDKALNAIERYASKFGKAASFDRYQIVRATNKPNYYSVNFHN